MISGMASSGNFMYNSMLASALAQLLPAQERKVIRLWIDHLHKITTNEQMANRNDYMWFLLLALKNRRITKPFNTIPYDGELIPLKELLAKMPPLLFLIFLAPLSSGLESHFVHVLSSHEHDHHLDFTPAPATDPPCPTPGRVCVPHVRCPQHVRDIEGRMEQCRLASGDAGICCAGHQRADSPSKARRSAIQVRKDSLHKAVASARSQVSALLQKESKLFSAGRSSRLIEGSPGFGHFRNFHISNPSELHQITELSHQALEIALATRALKESEGYTVEQIEMEDINSDLHGSSLGSACVTAPMCPHYQSKYRTLDGSCNNPVSPALGVAQTPYTRLLPPAYSDGVWTPRTSYIHGQQLPSPRLISAKLFSDVDRPDKEHTLMLMQFGQFLSHDISRGVTTRFANGSGISCCTNDGDHELPVEMRHFACMPITISPQDFFYKDFGQKCMNFVRSVLAPRQECNLGFSQQMNRVTHYIDGSGIYGTDQETISQLREFQGGRLKMFHDFGRDLLPLSHNSGDCLTMEQGSACFSAGDSRCNQMVSLVALHTLFAREHNRLANELLRLNPHWTDEQLFLEARRIVVAELQHIVYSQWLPEIIGHSAIKNFGLNVHQSGYSTYYDPYIDSCITNEFTTAALRFGHSIVDGKMKIYGHKKMEEIIDIPEVMFYPAKMRKREFFDMLLTTLTLESPQMADTSVSDALTKYMFRGGNPFGVDLISINIQRGRDHGLRCYNDYRQLIGMKKYNHFEEFGHEAGVVLQSLYAHPDDVDLYVGGLMETRAPGSVVGRTFRDIIADQFVRLRKGDKYFYDLHPSINSGSFTPEQLREIKLTTLARIICDNSDGILLAKQAVNPFRKPGLYGNELQDCKSSAIPHLNLIHWQEKV